MNKSGMNKQELIDSIAKLLRRQPSDIKPVVEAVFDTIAAELKSGGKVQLSGFGVFSVFHRKARAGVNPRKPEEKMQIPAVDTPKFKAGHTLKRIVKENK